MKKMPVTIRLEFVSPDYPEKMVVDVEGEDIHPAHFAHQITDLLRRHYAMSALRWERRNMDPYEERRWEVERRVEQHRQYEMARQQAQQQLIDQSLQDYHQAVNNAYQRRGRFS